MTKTQLQAEAFLQPSAKPKDKEMAARAKTAATSRYIEYLLLIGGSFAILSLRSLLIARAHSCIFDTHYHTRNGLELLSGISLRNEWLDNPPSGSALVVLPVFLLRKLGVQLDLDGWLQVIAVWKSLLLVPAIVVAFRWAGSLYGRRAAWLAAILLLFEPTLAAHTAYAANDTISVAAIAVSLFVGWGYVCRPSWWRLIATAVAMGITFAVKQNAIFALASFLVIALLWWVIRPWTARRSEQIAPLRPKGSTLILQAIAGVGIMFLVVWGMLLFDVDPGANHVPDQFKRVPFVSLTTHLWPAGLYLHSIIDMFLHAKYGHPMFLWGKTGTLGWWYYFPAVALYKVPIPLAIIVIFSIAFRRSLRWNEMPLIVIGCAFGLMLLTSTIQIGFRHALPFVFFAIIFASRSIAAPEPWRRVAVAVCAVFFIFDSVRFHPDYLSYVNFPRRRVWLQISDSNIEWAQGLKEASAWASTHAESGRPVSMLYYGRFMAPYLDATESIERVAGPNIRIIKWERRELPRSGILIASPIAITGQGLPEPLLPELKDIDPKEIIGNCLLVYDLDDLRRSGVKLW